MVIGLHCGMALAQAWQALQHQLTGIHRNLCNGSAHQV